MPVGGYDGGGQEIIAAYASVPGTPWGLVSEEEWAFFSSSNRRFGQLLLLLLALGMVLPAVGVGLFVYQHQAEALEQQRIEQELAVAQIVQQSLLPQELPALPSWQVSVHWQPA